MKVILDFLHAQVFAFVVLSLLISTGVAFLLAPKSHPQRVRHSGPITIFDAARRVSFLLTVTVLVFSWGMMVYFPGGFGHRDEIALLPERILPTTYGGRFFPLGHMEFNVLSLRLTGGALEPLYLFPLVELVATLYLINAILGRVGPLVRVLALTSSFLFAMAVPFANLIIPERNAIFLLAGSLYFYRVWGVRPSRLAATLAVLCSTLSLYYKEPMFAFFVGFSVVVVFYDCFLTLKQSPKVALGFWRKYPIESAYCISSLVFLFGYFFYVYYKGAPDAFYITPGQRSYIAGLLFYSKDVPLLTALLSTSVMALLLVPIESSDRRFAVAVGVGGLGYLAALIVIGLPFNGYYYAIPVLSLVLSMAFVLKHATMRLGVLRWRDSGAGALCARATAVLGLLIVFGLVAVRLAGAIRIDLIVKKNYQAEYAFIKKELMRVGDVSSIYYAPRTSEYNDYMTAILMIFIHKAGIDHEFDIYSESGCAVWNESYNGGRIRCIKQAFNPNNSYQILVIEGGARTVFGDSRYEILTHQDMIPRDVGPSGGLKLAVRLD